MTLLSAYEDLVTRSLGSLGDCLERLSFVAGLKASGEDYEHWGLEYNHGREAARGAIAQVHGELFVEVLSTPIDELWHQSSKETEQIVSVAPKLLCPNELGGGATEHMAFVLQTIRALNRWSVRSSRRAA